MQPFVKPFVLSFSTSRHGEPVTFGNFIKRARLAKGLKQAGVVRMVRVDEMTVVNWERYKTVPMRNRSMIQRSWQALSRDYSATESKFESVGNLSA